MPLAPIIDTALGGGVPGRPWILTVGGIDVIKSAGGFGTPYESIELTEAGPGGVSSMTFDVEDPGITWSPQKRQEVIFSDLTNPHTEFHGWISGYGSEVFGLGRVWHIRVDGPEKILDWLFVPTLTIPSGTCLREALQMILGASIGVGIPYTSRAKAGNNGWRGDIGEEIASWRNALVASLTSQDVVISGATVRQAWDEVIQATSTGSDFFGFGATSLSTGFLTVDMDLAVRAWGLDDNDASMKPSDWVNMTVTDTLAGTVRAHELTHDIDFGDDAAGVYVTGGNAAGTGLYGRGDGIPGAIVGESDSTVLTALGLANKGNAILQQKASASVARGSFLLPDHTPASTGIHPGAFVVLTDAQQSASGTYRISGISKTYTKLRQNWRVSYGGLAPSLPRAIRRLTRATFQ